MFRFIRPPKIVETISGTVSRIGPFLDGGGNWLTYELRLEGHVESYLVGVPNIVAQRSGIHLTRAGDLVELGLLAAGNSDRSRRALESNFRNLTLESSGVPSRPVSPLKRP